MGKQRKSTHVLFGHADLRQTTRDVDSKRTRARTSDLTLLRHVLAGGCMTAGRWFPEGTRVGVNAAVVQRDEKIFGEDAEESVPE